MDLLSESVIFMINCTILIDPSPKIGWYQYLQFGWNLVPYELVPVPKTPPVTPLILHLASAYILFRDTSSRNELRKRS